ncbi:unnamed protein product [Caenorhabditis nigoni]
MPLPQRSQGLQGHQRPQTTVTCGYSLQQLRIAVAPNPSHVNGGLRFAQLRMQPQHCSQGLSRQSGP